MQMPWLSTGSRVGCRACKVDLWAAGEGLLRAGLAIGVQGRPQGFYPQQALGAPLPYSRAAGRTRPPATAHCCSLIILREAACNQLSIVSPQHRTLDIARSTLDPQSCTFHPRSARVDVIYETIRGPQPVMSGPMAELRAKAGDRDRSGLTLRDSRYGFFQVYHSRGACTFNVWGKGLRKVKRDAPLRKAWLSVGLYNRR